MKKILTALLGMAMIYGGLVFMVFVFNNAHVLIAESETFGPATIAFALFAGGFLVVAGLGTALAQAIGSE